MDPTGRAGPDRGTTIEATVWLAQTVSPPQDGRGGAAGPPDPALAGSRARRARGRSPDRRPAGLHAAARACPQVPAALVPAAGAAGCLGPAPAPGPARRPPRPARPAPPAADLPGPRGPLPLPAPAAPPSPRPAPRTVSFPSSRGRPATQGAGKPGPLRAAPTSKRRQWAPRRLRRGLQREERSERPGRGGATAAAQTRPDPAPARELRPFGPSRDLAPARSGPSPLPAPEPRAGPSRHRPTQPGPAADAVPAA